jgi:hypothetical protein
MLFFLRAFSGAGVASSYYYTICHCWFNYADHGRGKGEREREREREKGWLFFLLTHALLLFNGTDMVSWWKKGAHQQQTG